MVCKVCGKEFEPKNKKGVFCSGSCKQKDYRHKINGLIALAKGNIVDARIDKVSDVKHVAKIEVEVPEKAKSSSKEDIKAFWQERFKKKNGL